MNTDIIIIRPQQRLAVSPVTAWAIVRERTGKRPLVLARICGNGELSRRLAVTTAVTAMRELLIEDLDIEHSDWSKSMAGHVHRILLSETEGATQ